MAEKMLPPLPPSDPDSLRTNGMARDFWDDAQIISIPKQDQPKHEHRFINVPGGIKCERCFFGLLGGELIAKEGEAYARGEKINFPK